MYKIEIYEQGKVVTSATGPEKEELEKWGKACLRECKEPCCYLIKKIRIEGE